MNATQIHWLSVSDIRKRMKSSCLRLSELPVEHAISFPLPTKRWGAPSYAFFASPARRRPGQPVTQGAPDRCWVFNAHGGGLIVYALWRAIPFSADTDWGTITLPPLDRSIAEHEQALATIEMLLDRVAPSFFTGEPGDEGTRRALKEALTGYLPQPLLPQYSALVPDFFAWLST